MQPVQLQHAPVYCPLQPQPRQIRPTPPVFSLPMRPAGYHQLPPPSPPIAPLQYSVMHYPPQLQHHQSAPHVPVFSASRWISPPRNYSPPPSSQPQSQMIQEPPSSTTISGAPSSKGKRPAQEDSGSGITKKVCFFFFKKTFLFWSLILWTFAKEYFF